MQIIVTVPDDDFESYEEEPYDVAACDSVDILMKEFSIMDDLPEGMSATVEQAFIVGELVRYFEDSQTFEDYDFMDGDTIHFGLAPKELQIIVHNFVTNLQVLVGVSALYTLARLKKILYSDYPKVFGSSFIPYTQIVFKHHGEFLLDRITLADCNLNNFDTLYIDAIHYEIFVAIPAYGKIMERLVFRPSDTIAAIKGTVAELHQSRYSAVLREDTIPVVLRGAIQNKTGTLVYVCLHLYHQKMLAHMDESTEESSQPGYFCILKKINTVRDIYRMVDKEDGYELTFVPLESKDKWSETACIFDYTWSRTFAPQIDVDPVTWSDDKHIPLYFFPCVPRVRTIDKVSSLCTVRNFVESVLERENMRGVDRILCKLDTSIPLSGWLPLFTYNITLKSKTFLVLRKCLTPIYERRMKVYITWLGRPNCPIEFIVEPDDTIVNLKDRIENLLKVPILMQKLVFSGKTLAVNSAPLSSVGIKEDSIIEVCLPDPEAHESIITCNNNNNNLTEKSLCIVQKG